MSGDIFHPSGDAPKYEFCALLVGAMNMPVVHREITLERIARTTFGAVHPDARWQLLRDLAPVKADIQRLSKTDSQAQP